jgi:sulfatase modifying factor 1
MASLQHPVLAGSYRSKHMVNIRLGAFPCENLAGDGYTRTSRVDAFPPNNFSLLEMIGNVWEWTTDWYSTRHTSEALKACCIPENPRGGSEVGSYHSCQPRTRIPRKVVKGGSHPCAPVVAFRRPLAIHSRLARQ